MKEASARFNPFPGLRSFEPREEHLFFGRELQIDELLKRLRRTRFLAVVGISGSGKSSLVLSGLIPALHRGLMTRAGSSWRVAIFRPGDDPIGNLATALNAPDVLGADGERQELGRSLLDATLRHGALGLVEAVHEARDVERRIPKYDNVLVVVDQFEELFRLKASSRHESADDEALAFIRLLQEATQQKEVPIYVVLTMRTDFMEHCVEYPGLPEAINDGAFIVSRMSREEQRAAIVGPVAVGGGEIAPRLVLRLLNSVGDNPDQLPVLQHALMRTWSHWEKETSDAPALDIEQYEAIGTMERALSQHAEEVYEDLGSERRKVIAEKMFKALTDKEPGRRGVRRPIQVRKVCELTGGSVEGVIAVVDRFRQPGRSFLMPPSSVDLDGDSVIDISHESLMRVWERLIGWVEEETESAQFYLRLARAAALHEEGSGGLWRNPELEFAVQWRDKNQPTEVWARRYDPSFERNMRFLEESRQAREREMAAEERARRRKLHQARIMAAVSVVVAVVILGFGLFAWHQSQEAQRQRAKALEQEQEALAQKAKAEEESQRARDAEISAREAAQEAERQRAIAESQEQEALDQKAKAEEESLRAKVAERSTRESAQEAERQRAIAESQELEALGQKAKAEQESQRARDAEQRALEKEQEAQRLRLLESARALAIQVPRLQQEGQEEVAALLAVHAYRLTLEHGGNPETAAFYEALRLSLKRLVPERVLRHHDGMVRAVALSGAGYLLASGDDTNGVRLLDLRRPEDPSRELPGIQEIRSLAYHPSGERLAAGSFDGSIQVWDLNEPESPPLRLTVPGDAAEAESPSPVVSLAYRGDGSLAAASLAGKVTLWPSGNPEPVGVSLLEGHPHRVLSVAFSPKDPILAAASAGGGVLLWDLDHVAEGTGGLPGEQTVRAVAFSRDGSILAAGTAEGTIELWDVTQEPPIRTGELLGHTAAVNSLSFNPGQDLLASSSSDATLRLWHVHDRAAEPIVLSEHDSWVWTAAFSGDGETLVSGSADRTIRIWATRAELLAREVCGRVSRSLSEEEWSHYLPSDIPHGETCPVP